MRHTSAGPSSHTSSKQQPIAEQLKVEYDMYIDVGAEHTVEGERQEDGC